MTFPFSIKYSAQLDENYASDRNKETLEFIEDFSSVQFYFAELNGEVIGYIKLMAGGNTYIPEIKAMEIARFYVSNAFKGLKVGKKLMETAENLARTTDCKAMWLSVWQKNPLSIEIYKKLGYNIVGTTTFILGADVQDDYIMVKHLTT